MLIARTMLFYFAFLKDAAGAAFKKRLRLSAPTDQTIDSGSRRHRLRNTAFHTKGCVHRISTARKEKAGSRFVFSLIEPYWPLPYSTRVEWCQAGGLDHLLQYIRKYNAESPKQGSKRFNSAVKTINIANLGIIYLWLCCRYDAPYGGDSATPDECSRDNVEDITFLEAEDSYIGKQINEEDITFLEAEDSYIG